MYILYIYIYIHTYIYTYIYIYISTYTCFVLPRTRQCRLGTHQGQTGNKNFNVYLSVGIFGEPEHGPDLEAITFFPAFDFRIT